MKIASNLDRTAALITRGIDLRAHHDIIRLSDDTAGLEQLGRGIHRSTEIEIVGGFEVYLPGIAHGIHLHFRRIGKGQVITRDGDGSAIIGPKRGGIERSCIGDLLACDLDLAAPPIDITGLNRSGVHNAARATGGKEKRPTIYPASAGRADRTAVVDRKGIDIAMSLHLNGCTADRSATGVVDPVTGVVRAAAHGDF